MYALQGLGMPAWSRWVAPRVHAAAGRYAWDLLVACGSAHVGLKAAWVPRCRG